MGNSININVEEFSSTLEQELKLYSSNVTNALKKQTKKSTSDLVKETKSKAPKSSRARKVHYVDSISSKKTNETDFDIEYTWYVKAPNYRLSHLLEKGHRTRNFKRTRALHFIENATKKVQDEYVRKVGEILKNGR